MNAWKCASCGYRQPASKITTGKNGELLCSDCGPSAFFMESIFEGVTTTQLKTASKYGIPHAPLVYMPGDCQFDVWAFTDGSSTGAYGCILIRDDPLHPEKRIDEPLTPPVTRNVFAEIQGVRLACHNAHEGEFVGIVSDFLGTGMWGSGRWKTNKPEVLAAMEQLRQVATDRKLRLWFTHHKGHGRDDSDFTRWNNEVDQMLAIHTGRKDRRRQHRKKKAEQEMARREKVVLKAGDAVCEQCGAWVILAESNTTRACPNGHRAKAVVIQPMSSRIGEEAKGVRKEIDYSKVCGLTNYDGSTCRRKPDGHLHDATPCPRCDKPMFDPAIDHAECITAEVKAAGRKHLRQQFARRDLLAVDFDDVESKYLKRENTVGIVGSRDYPRLGGVVQYVRELPEDAVVVSGGARGVDRTAAKIARDRGLKVIEHLPAKGQPFGIAARKRNAKIVAASRRLVAFIAPCRKCDQQGECQANGWTHGTMSAIRMAEQKGIPIEVFDQNGHPMFVAPAGLFRRTTGQGKPDVKGQYLALADPAPMDAAEKQDDALTRLYDKRPKVARKVLMKLVQKHLLDIEASQSKPWASAAWVLACAIDGSNMQPKTPEQVETEAQLCEKLGALHGLAIRLPTLKKDRFLSVAQDCMKLITMIDGSTDQALRKEIVSMVRDGKA